MKRISRLVVFTLVGTFTAVALASPKEEPKPDPIDPPRPTTAAEARSALISEAKSLPAMKAYPENWWADLASGKGWSVKKIPAAEARHRVEDTLTEREKVHAIRYGTLDSLRAGECWTLENYGFEGGFGATPIAYLDAKSGTLLFIWVAPEG